KVDELLGMIKDFGWTLGEALYHIFRNRDEHGQRIQRSEKHMKMASRFLGGRSNYMVAHILDSWMQSPYGLPKASHSERSAQYSPTKGYQELK
ncbi:hypothetical protein BDN71DRAFT_1360670, partial [Pleurotus eryngii]